MSKIELEFEIKSYMKNILKKGLFSNADVIEVLIETLRYVLCEKPTKHNDTKLKIVINKMNRFFYILEKKYFSIAQPFNIVFKDEQCIIKDSMTHINIDNKVLSYLASFFEEYKNNTMLDVFTLYEQFCDDNIELSENEKNDIKIIINELIWFEYGYVRYEDDEIRENGLLHPRYHLDINCLNESKYKIGVENSIDDAWFGDCLDITKQCKVIKV